MTEPFNSTTRFFLYCLMVVVLINYLFLILFYFTIPNFDGTVIDQTFQTTLSNSSYLGFGLIITQAIFFLCMHRISSSFNVDLGRDCKRLIRKTKIYSVIGFVYGILLTLTLFLFVDVRFDLIVNQLSSISKVAEVTSTDLIVAGVWVIILGTHFIIAAIFTNFYFGRVIYHHGTQKGDVTQSRRWKIFRIFGIIWSLQFFLAYLLPGIISLIVFGVLTLIFIYVMWAIPRFGHTYSSNDITPAVKSEQVLTSRSAAFKRIVQISMVFCLLLFGICWFGSTGMYGLNKEWYDWGFYFVLGLILLIIPSFCLVYMKHPVGQWLLKRCFLIIALIGFFYFLLAIFSYEHLLTNYIFGILFQGKVNTLTPAPGFFYKPAQFILFGLVFFTSMISFIGLKEGLIKTEQHKKFSIKDLFRWKTFSKTAKFFTLTFAILVGLLFVTYDGFGATVTLENDQSFTPALSFWEWDDWSDHNNATLDKLAQYNISLYGGHPYGDIYQENMTRYSDRGLKVRPTISYDYNSNQNNTLEDMINWISWYETDNHSDYCPVDGFMVDIENGGTLYEFNRTLNDLRASYNEELIEYAHNHNFSMHFTAMHTTINDIRDGDYDVSIYNQLNCVPPTGWDTWNWMLYRTESATSYEEKSPYFTYIWVKEITDSFKAVYGDKFKDKYSVSIGVTSDDRALYADPDGLDQLIWDLRICDALKIPEVIIFNLNPLDSDDFLGMFGLAGIDEIMNKMNNWTTLELPYSRSATFFGNIKYEGNPMGSVFGNYIWDLYLDNGLIFFTLTWLLVQVYTYAVFIKRYNIQMKEEN